MDNRDFRWIAGIILLAVFGVLAYGGGRAAPKAQAPQNVLVTNTSSQPVQVAARPGTGAYIVSVANAPTVKVASSAAAPVVTKDSNNPDSNGRIYSSNFTMTASGVSYQTSQVSFSSSPVVIDAISLSGESVVAGESIDSAIVTVFDTTSVRGYFFFNVPGVQNGLYSSTLQPAHIPVPAGGSIELEVLRHGGSTNECQVFYTVAYHIVPNP